MSDKSTTEHRQTCSTCHAGHINMQHITYFTWLSGQLITVPDFPAWICDMCGFREYDQRALSWLNIILSPDTGQAQRPHPPQIHPAERPAIQPEL